MEQKTDNTAEPAPGLPEEGEPGGKEPKSRKTLKRVIIIISCLVIVAAVFCGGWFGGLYWGNAQFRSYKWALNLIEQYYYGDYDTSVSENSAYALAAMLDDYSEYYSADEYSALLAENAGSKSGIGVTYQYVTDDAYGDTGCLIVSVVGNSPAYYAGIRAGVVICSGTAGGRTTEFTQATDFSSFISSQDTGAEFTLTSTDGTSFSVSRENYQASYTIMYTRDATYSFESGEKDGYLYLAEDTETGGMEDLPEGYAYIQLQQFYGTADQEMDILIGEFTDLGCTSLILDLRSDGGGSVSTMEKIAGCFVPETAGSLAMTAEYKDGSVRSYAIGRSNTYTLPEGTDIYILANTGTASASEALMGILLSYGLTDYSHIYLSDYGDNYLSFTGSTKNCRTYGKGIMQSTFVNSMTGEALKLTVAKIFWPDDNHTCIHDVGITAADGCNTISTPWVATKGDMELRDAIQRISSAG
ncbi:MAG: S41 family peptidase [Clostridia bacterium]|nr:S41 family peptidase [Clostridia bacterium]